MLFKNNNKALPIINVLEVQQKLCGFENVDHGKARKRKNKKRKLTDENQVKVSV